MSSIPMFKSINRTFYFAILLGFMGFKSACAVNNCTFDSQAISEEQFANNNSIAIFKWYPESDEVKGVLSNGNLFSIKYWSCHHYGKHATMVLGPQIQSIPYLLNDHVLQLARASLDEVEYSVLSDFLANKSLTLNDSPEELFIPSTIFDAFYIKTYTFSETVFIEIKLYRS